VNRRAFVAAMAAVIAAPPAEAQRPVKVHRIAYLSPVGAQDSRFSGLQQGLRDLGYVEGHNISIDYRSSGGRFDRLAEIASDVANDNFAVIVTHLTQASLAAKQATTTVPIVMVGVADPVAAGLVASLSRPGGNITGTSSASVLVAAKALELLRDSIPRLRRVAALWNPNNMVFQQQMIRGTEAAASKLRIQLYVAAARDSDELAKAIASIAAQRAEALSVLADPLFAVHRGQIAALAIKARLPSASGFREFADAGGLLAYGPNFHELNRATAAFVHRILQGANPSDLPVEEPTKFELIINLKTAKALNLTIPPSLLLRADQVIE
jgi:putative ABC transport system substrate-binding protein